MIKPILMLSSMLCVAFSTDYDYFQDRVIPEITLFDRNVGDMRGVCGNFSFGNPDSGEFSTPNYPDLYPANIECVRVVEAPANHVIHLDFRGSVFEVERTESSDKCQYDYLEVRNGLYGFSPLIGRFCGNKYPPAVTADSGHMWLYFKSDRSIQYRGFKAVTYFSPVTEADTPEPGIICSFSNNPLDDDGVFGTAAMREVLDQFLNSTQKKIECVWKLETAHVDHKIRVYFEEFQLGIPNECNENFVSIYYGTTAHEHRLKQFCGKSAATVTTNSDRVYLRFHLSKAAIDQTSIKASYTIYVPGKNCSSVGYFPCGDDVCISTRLVCNGRPNCITNNDEKRCPTPSLPSFREVYGPYLVILVVILLVIAVIVTCIAVVNICPRIRKKTARSAAYSSVPQSVNSTTAVFSPAVSPPPPPPPMPPSGTVPSLVNCDLVYSTVVPGPDAAQGRLYELLPKMSSEDLHLYLYKQQAKTCLSNGKVPLKMSDSKTDSSVSTKNSKPDTVSSPEESLKEKRRRMLHRVLGKPDVVLNGLAATANKDNKRRPKTVKFYQAADSIDETSTVSDRGAPIGDPGGFPKRPLVDNITDQSATTMTSSTDTLDDLSQVEINRTTDDSSDVNDEMSSRSSPISTLVAATRKYTPSEGFVLSI